jgi:integrase
MSTEHHEELPNRATESGETLGDRDPASITVPEVADWVAALSEKHKAGTVGLYLLTFRLLLDFAQVDPNPARDPRVKKPKQVREEPNPPTAEQVEQVLAAIGAKWQLLFVTIEQGALRLGEAVSLRWQDVDAANLRLRLPRSATKRDKARWVYLPEWLVEAIEQTCPLEDRVPERRVFPGITEASAYQRSREPASRRASRISTRTTSGTAGSRCGTSPASRRGSLPSGPATRGRRCRSTSTRTSCRRTRSSPSGSCPCSRTRGGEHGTTPSTEAEGGGK